MIYQQLKEDCRSLGFENTFPSDAIFLSSANRALRLISCERGRKKSVLLPIRSRKKTLLSRSFSHIGGSEEVFSASGRAFSFRVSGCGCVTVTDRGESSTERFDTPCGAVRGFLSGSGEATLTFSGDFAFTVSDLAVFPDLTGGDLSEIPLAGDDLLFSMEDLVPDFLCFSSAATDEGGDPLPGIALESGEVCVPEGFSGRIRIPYRTSPRAITGDNPTEKIDIPPECEVLLPLLTSSYLWLDDDPEKATYYLSLYREALASVRRNESGSIVPRYHDVTGW